MSGTQKGFRSTRDRITDTLRAEILCGQWSNEVPVREHSLAERFGVSRGPVRDSLLQLSQEGVLVYQANKGVRVNSPPIEEQRQLLQSMRRQMETFCLRKCMDQLD
ncbi:MAG: GntR family transcriptional regulator, partial [Verrucomicrobiota bacterium]|nr:GntR family transcriptional regulator [Verrucomicrobiota bacterium]